MQVQHTVYLLKVLSGANAGAIVRLKTGGLIIGRSMVCDIILHDENIADEHVKIDIDDDIIKLHPIALPIYVDGDEIAMKPLALYPYQVVTLGDVDFFIADPRISESEARVLNSRQKKDSGLNDTLKNNANYLTGRKSKRNNNQSFLSNKSYLWLGLGLLLLGNLLYFAPNLLNFSEKIGLKSSPKDQVSQLVSKMENKTLQLKESSAGMITLSGYTKSQAERNAIISQLAGVSSSVSHRIWVESDLVQSAEMIAHTLGERSIHFKPIDKGDIAAFGFVSNSKDWGRVKASILDDVAGITSIDESELQTLLKRMEALQQFIEKNDLSTRIRVAIEQGKITVSGELTKNEIDRWKDLYSEFVATYGEGPTITEKLYDVRDRIKLSIRSVSIGETPYLVSKNGKKYLEGANLGNNYFIKEIRPDYILLTNNGIEIPIYYGLEDK